ncbi:MAG: undecaprenyldiphospho-muramoylpentapeptide beta-N-acetylglucosaminyltransferase [Alphaproteobacteria bacterium]
MTRPKATKANWVILAAGGTGGHMFPAQALARELLARGRRVALITDRRGGGFGPDLPQVETHCIHAGAMAGTGLGKRLLGAIHLGIGFLQARDLMKTLTGDVVVGFGGYASVPTVFAAARRGRRVILHEQNAVLGRANRLLAPRAWAIATSFESVEGIASADRDKIRITGNPVRPGIAALAKRPAAVADETGPLRLLVVGGSQGAAVFNTVVPAAIGLLRPELRSRIEICQQVRGPEIDKVADVYRTCGVTADLAAFVENMAERLGAAHLVISRAGASTMAELTAAGRPAIMVPYPWAADDHQTANAQRLVEAGGGWLMPQSMLTPENLAERLDSLLSDPAVLGAAGRCARAKAYDQAAIDLADLVTAAASDDNGAERPAHGEAAA